MTQPQALFLEAVGAALKNEYALWDGTISREDWIGLFSLAEAHRMLPMVYQAVCRCPAIRAADPAILSRYRLYSMQMAALQVRRTAEFTRILDALVAGGVDALVVKGITCRNLYPNPDFRLSSDEDVLVPPDQFRQCHHILSRLGYTTDDPEDPAYELMYRNPGEMLFLELHRSLFPPEHEAYGDLNRFFTGIDRRAQVLDDIPTPHPTDHLLYLLLHAFKHFLHSGFGLRQVCDLILFANRYGSEVDWDYLLTCCRQVRAEQFAASLFRIGWKYLGFSLEQSRYPVSWQAIYVEEGDLLEDILQAGIYGSADRDRVHSSNITLQAMSSQKQSGAGSLLHTVFPPPQTMVKKYPYVKNSPLLLPLAWTERILSYGKSSATVSDTLRIGRKRLALLKRYGILDDNSEY